MKFVYSKSFSLLLFVTFFYSVSAQIEYVGFPQVNEVRNIYSGTQIFDTLLILNNGTLNIDSGATVVVNKALILVNTGKLNVRAANFVSNKIFYATDNTITNFRDIVTINGDLVLEQNAQLYIDSSYVNVPASYKSQFE